MGTPAIDTIDLIEAVLAGNFTPNVCNRVREIFTTWDRCDGSVSIENCGHFPGTAAKYRKAKRDKWIARAAPYVDGTLGTYRKAECLADALAAFQSRGEWRFWQSRSEPPVDASSLRRALFYICRLNDGKVIEVRQIYRILSGGPPDIFSSNDDNGSTVK